jgi:hypothetical protein
MGTASNFVAACAFITEFEHKPWWQKERLATWQIGSITVGNTELHQSGTAAGPKRLSGFPISRARQQPTASRLLCVA